MTLLTAADAQALGVGLGLDPALLQSIIDAEEAEIVRRFGVAAAGITEPTAPRGDSLYLRRPVASVMSITEYQYVGDPAPLTRVAADYFVWPSEGRIERAAASLPWGRICTVVYMPADDSSLRKTVLLELTRIATEQDAAAGGSVSGLGYSISAPSGVSAQTATQARSAQYARLGWRS